MTNAKRKRRGIHYMFSRLFRKHGAVPLSTYRRIYKKGDIVDIEGMGTVQYGMPHKCYRGKTGRVYSITQHAGGIVVNKQSKGSLPHCPIHFQPAIIYLMRIYKKGDIVDIEGMGTVQYGMPHKCYRGKTGRVYSITQHAGGIVVNKQGQKGMLVFLQAAEDLEEHQECTLASKGLLPLAWQPVLAEQRDRGFLLELPEQSMERAACGLSKVESIWTWMLRF
ncbi:60S ribosomal protein L21 [Myotis davidii]|uniref:60S ribosomal protein L21 n=1 Tax=Myotis davidii TaxID=225400 RepID=L5LP44_MYODS|nr:60S ribosomal protein L21 [Myotis davidii]